MEREKAKRKGEEGAWAEAAKIGHSVASRARKAVEKRVEEEQGLGQVKTVDEGA